MKKIFEKNGSKMAMRSKKGNTNLSPVYGISKKNQNRA